MKHRKSSRQQGNTFGQFLVACFLMGAVWLAVTIAWGNIRQINAAVEKSQASSRTSESAECSQRQ